MNESLDKYRRMRDFGATPEPAGKSRRKKGARPIFVIQKHQASHLHYDFRLEIEGVLVSWAVPKGPSYDPSIRRLAMQTENHPYEYGSFEGVIPAGNYGAGNVIIWDQGEWELAGEQPGTASAALKNGKLTFRLFGRKMFGEWALVRMRGKEKGKNEWLLLKHRDEFAAPGFDITSFAPESVVSGETVEELGSEREWQSNRKGGGRRVRTVAERLRDESKKARPKAGTKKTASKKAASKKAPSTKSDSKKAAKTETPRAGAKKSLARKAATSKKATKKPTKKG
jgi:bifunctional non-homologous end joining protein LigD